MADNEFVTSLDHENGHIHRIGGALLNTGKPENTSAIHPATRSRSGVLETVAKEDHVHEAFSDYNEIGEVALFSFDAFPQGWLIADGYAWGRDTFPDLFNRIGTTYGPGDGVTTFNIPNAGAAPGGLTYYIKAYYV